MQPYDFEAAWEEYDRELSATCPCYAQAEVQPQCWPDVNSDVEECQGNPELLYFAAWWDYIATYERQLAAMADVLRQMLAHHRAQLPSEARDLYGGDCGCPLCQAALAALGVKP